jgi:hypothetical protein
MALAPGAPTGDEAVDEAVDEVADVEMVVDGE